jgi:hypothetical protein
MLPRLVLASMFALSGILKVAYPTGAGTAITYLLDLDLARSALVMLGLTLAGYELLLALWLFSSRQRAAYATAGVTLIVFSAALVLLMLDERAPGCGCWGPFAAGRVASSLGLVGNCCALLLAGAGLRGGALQ